MQFNEAQQQAITHRDGPALVLAGPGSGKTTVLTGRVHHLISEGIAPASILVVTFTRAAAKEMETRFLRGAKQAGEGVTFSTCHALFLRILRKERGYTERDVLSEPDRRRLLKGILRDLGIEAGEETLRFAAGDISRMKNCGIRPDADPEIIMPSGWCAPDAFRRIYRTYDRMLRQRRKIEFDDMPLLCLDLFDTSPQALARWQDIWTYLLIDEFQDINPVQYRLLSLLSAPQDYLFAVGDDDQSIYAFRGASPQLILDFESDHPGTKKIFLDVNYRCPEEILAPSLRLIGNNVRRMQKRIRGCGRRDGSVRVLSVRGQQEEAAAACLLLQESLSAGVPAEEIAVLYRSRSAVRHLTRALSDRMIPYRMKQGEEDLYDHWITKDLFAYLSLAGDRSSRQDLLRILNRPDRGLPREIFARAGSGWEDWPAQLTEEERGALRRLIRDLDRIAGYTPSTALRYILDGMGYGRYLSVHAARHQIPEEELRAVPEQLYEEAGAHETFTDWREAVALSREMGEGRPTPEAGILLTTIHGAKGLEFSVVVILDAAEGLLPIRSAVSQAQIEEERRLFYVAMTRSKKDLFILVPERFHANAVRPSRFLSEAGLSAEMPG